MAVPFEVLKPTETGRPDAALSETVKVAVPAASLTVTSLITSDGTGSLSVIVAVPVAAALEVVPALRVAVSVKVSLVSFSVSLTIAERTSTLVEPAAMVAELPAAQVVPPSVDTSSAGL